ncbi:MAG TPA: aldehyde ferredoxin oxidoreductase family protein [Anaerolineae bacterium]|nr:aldehyde ferredoxin oxidoreductase family protein [Anaerolineae bacterium]
MHNVYAGRWLRVDLESREIGEERISDEEARTWLLGSGLAAHLLHEGLDPARDPLDPASPLLVFNGLLTGTFAPAAARSSWCARSPLTGIWCESNMGGHWGAQLRFAGFDGLVVTGRAPAPVYLWVHDGQAEVRDATHLWGSSTFETHDRLRKETDPQAQVACIGPAGENLVRLAGVMSGGQAHNRTAGRGGMGALMGSKNLKAIVVRGHKKPAAPDPARFRAVVREANSFIRQRSEGLSLTGTAGGVPATEHFGDLSLKNWQEGSWPEGARAISGQTIRETIWARDTHCFACPVGCGKAIEVKEGPYAGTWGEGPEYETLAGFGGNLLIDDLPALVAINARCNQLGLDTISTAAVIAFATEAMERGLISADDAGGLRLAWGEPEPVLALVEQIARREGLGALLAGGVRAAAAQVGPGAQAFALHVKGLEMPYHDPRAFVDMGLNYATASRGACHLEALSYWRGYGLEWPGWQEGPHDRFASDEASVQLAIAFQDFVGTYNPLGLCKFMIKGGLDPARTVELVNGATSWDWTADDLVRAGERLFNLKRLINLRLGVTQADDTLPRRFLAEPRPSGTAAGVLPDLERMLPRYYELRGWDAEGTPTRERLEGLGL